MGTAMVVLLIVLGVLFVGGVPMSRMALLGLATAVGSVIVGFAESYRRARIFAFLNPWEDPSNTGYQIAQSLVALGSGHLTGVGLGASRAKWGFLPNAHTDFIFAIIGEELGLLGTVPVVLLFGAFAYLGVRTALRAPDRFGTLLAAGVTVWIVGQSVVNVGAVIGMLPVTGVPLPFVSFGGSSLFLGMVAVGILVNVARQGTEGGVHGRPAVARRPVPV
jgi:cell division protein FtsW